MSGGALKRLPGVRRPSQPLLAASSTRWYPLAGEAESGGDSPGAHTHLLSCRTLHIRVWVGGGAVEAPPELGWEGDRAGHLWADR